MILTVTLNPCVDHALFVDSLVVGDTNRVARVEKDAGGKGINLSRVYAELGGETIATGFLGGSAAALIRSVMHTEGVKDEFVNIQGDTRTNYSVEDLAGGPPTTFNSKGPIISQDEWNELVDFVSKANESATWVALAGSLPGQIASDAYLKLGAGTKARIMLDADGAALLEGLKAMPHFIKPNSAEAGRLLNRSIETDTEAIEASQELYQRIGGGNRYAVISRGKDGAVMTCSEGSFIGKSPKIEPKSTIGSGDSMIAGMLWAIDSGFDAAESLRWGLAAGAATAVSDGSEIARKGVIKLLFNHAEVSIWS
jgi:1-phosphofructokinase